MTAHRRAPSCEEAGGQTSATHRQAPPTVLTGRSVGIDARYLKRPGVGISQYLHRGVYDLLDAGARVTLLTDDESHRPSLLSAYPSVAALALPGRSGFVWEQRALRRHLSAADYDAFIAPANFGLPLGYRGKTRLVLVVHDLIPLRLPHLYLLGRPAWAAKYLLSLVIAAVKADHVIAVSHATATDVSRLLRRSAACVVYPRIPEATKPAAGDRRSPTPYFVYNGGSDIRKNVPTLLRAFSQVRSKLADSELVILGTGYDGFRPMMEELGITEHVRMLGYVDEAGKTEILRGSLAVVYPSRLEGFGLPVVEALAAGTLVVCGTGGALREVGGDAPIYVHRLDAESVAAAMATTADESVRDRARQAGEIQLSRLREAQQASSLASAIAACLGCSAGSRQAVR